MSLMQDILTPWTPAAGIDFAFATAEVHVDHLAVSVRLVDGRTAVDRHHDLVFRFERVAAFALYEEFIHPEQGTVWGREPLLPEKYTYPCLIVSNAAWFESLKVQLDISHQNSVHYRLCTCSPVIDIVSDMQPRVKWIERPPNETKAASPDWAIASDA